MQNKKLVFFADNLIASTVSSVLKIYFLLKILKFFDADQGGYGKIWIRDPV
jgi:hypothetical protein